MRILYAPEVRRYFDILKYKSSGSFNSGTVYDAQTYRILDILFDRIKQLRPQEGTTDVWNLWFKAPRGPIEKFGDYKEWLDDGEVESFDEFQRIWLDFYPEETCWFPFTAIERQENEYRGIFLNHGIIIEQPKEIPPGFPLDIHEFAEWLLDAVDACIEALRNGHYNDDVEAHLPLVHRTGTILRRDWWSVYPDTKEEFLAGLSPEDIAFFVQDMREPAKSISPLKTTCANDYFKACALGYAANHYSGLDKTPREQYYLHADGRDDGLGDIDPDDSGAFRIWLTDRTRHGGHPWEVARGGNSTHISLYPVLDEGGYTFLLAGSSVGRTIETVKFYLALRKAGLPVKVKDGNILANRLTGEEKMGIVPRGIPPVYCEGLFSDERIISFVNLDEEDVEELAPHCTWQPIPKASLRGSEPEK